MPSAPHPVRRRAPRSPLLATVLALAAAPVASVAAQMPSVPLLQNGFVRPGAVVAANYGAGDGTDIIGAAGAWTPGSGRFQVSGGVGALGADGVDGRKVAGGLRVALPVPTPWTRDPASAFGIAAFAGAGGVALDEGTLLQLPVGVGVGYRRRLGAQRVVSVFATPFYQWTRVTGVDVPEEEEDELDSSLFRVGLGAEALLTRRIGVTLGYELGANAESGRPGPTGGIFGAGVTFAF